MTKNFVEQTFYIIKPEGLKNAAAIKEIILNNDLKIIESKQLLLKKDIIKVLYSNLNKDLLEAHFKFMCNKINELGIIEGQNAVKKFLEISGKHTNPDLCSSGTIRNIFGEKMKYKIGQAIYYKNAIHRSKTLLEATRDIDIFRKLQQQEIATS